MTHRPNNPYPEGSHVAASWGLMAEWHHLRRHLLLASRLVPAVRWIIARLQRTP